jgi:NAD(P)-dependent dehydrogenase (short-subunit alcohol dehydrogenase family)
MDILSEEDIISPNFAIEDAEGLKVASLFDFAGKTALVTGGSSGIGRMIAATFVSNGIKTYIVGRKQEQLDSTVTELSVLGECHAIRADLGTLDGVGACAAQLAERERKLNILVNNAGATWGASVDTFPADAWDKVFNLNVKHLFFLTQKLIPQLTAAATDDDWGRVINLSSVGARLASEGSSIAYGASKAAVEHLTRLLARKLAAHRIACNCIAPGWFPSKMNAPLGVEAAQAWLNNTPLGRLGDVRDMGGLALFLSSRAGLYINGQTVTIDGGETL